MIQEIFRIPFPGATYTVPGIVTIGPSLSTDVALEAEVGFAGSFEAYVQLAAWDVQQTFPTKDLGDEWKPKALSEVDRSKNKLLSPPIFDWSLRTYGKVSAHLKPKFSFGLVFSDTWKVEDAKIELIADSYINLHASAGVSNNDFSCPFKYGIDVGADLFVQVHAPSIGGWDLGTPRWDIAKINPIPVISGPECNKDGLAPSIVNFGTNDTSFHLDERTLVPKRQAETVYGPIFTLGGSNLLCPDIVAANCSLKLGEDALFPENDGDTIMTTLTHPQKETVICRNTGGVGQDGIRLRSPTYPAPSDIMSGSPTEFANIPGFSGVDPNQCHEMRFNRQASPIVLRPNEVYGTEHMMEFKLIKDFFDTYGDCATLNVSNYSNNDFNQPARTQSRPTLFQVHMHIITYSLVQ